MTYQQSLKVPNVARWTNDGGEPPDWLKEGLLDPPSANGSLLIKTPLGSARVHPGQIVIQHSSGLWVRSSEEVAEFVAALTAIDAVGANAIGPGKSTTFGTTMRSGSGRPAKFKVPKSDMPSIEWKHVEKLTVDPAYQRSIDNTSSQKLIASIAANFDWRLCMPLVVSLRPDRSLVIMDGQHRWAAAIRRGDLPQLPCCVFSYESAEEEARLFILANRARKPISRLDDFHAAVAAGDEDALEIRDLVSDAGLLVARTTTTGGARPGEIAFTSSVSYALRTHGSQVVSAALTTMAQAFHGQPLYGTIFSALVSIFASPPDSFDPDLLPNALALRDTQGWNFFSKDARAKNERNLAVREAMVQALQDVRTHPATSYTHH